MVDFSCIARNNGVKPIMIHFFKLNSNVAPKPVKNFLKALSLLFITLENSKGLEIQGLRDSLVVQTVKHLPAMRET